MKSVGVSVVSRCKTSEIVDGELYVWKSTVVIVTFKSW